MSGDPQTRYQPKYQLLNVEDDEKSKLVLTRDLPNRSKKNAWIFYLSTLLFTLGPHGVIRLCKALSSTFHEHKSHRSVHTRLDGKPIFGAYNSPVGLINIDDACSKIIYM